MIELTNPLNSRLQSHDTEHTIQGLQHRRQVRDPVVLVVHQQLANI